MVDMERCGRVHITIYKQPKQVEEAMSLDLIDTGDGESVMSMT